MNVIQENTDNILGDENMNDYLNYINDKLKGNSDLKHREIKCAKGTISLLFIDDLCDSKFISQYIIAPLIKSSNLIRDTEIIKNRVLYSNSLGDITSKEDALLHILSGDVIILSDFYDNAIYCEAKGFSKRPVSSPLTETVVKGPREGFNEAIMDNIALIRRRIKSPQLKIEYKIMGRISNTTVALLYIQDLVPQKVLKYINDRLEKTDIDFLLDTNYIEEQLKDSGTLFDTIGYTEKADTAASKILQGRVAILVDGTPFALSAPYFFIENFQMADDYYLNMYYTSIVRIVRLIAFVISVFLPGLYIALTTYHFSLIPLIFVFRLSSSRADVPIPTILEVYLMLFFFQLLREAGIRLPQPIGQSMSIVGALILGQAAVSAGLSSQSTVIIVAVSAISSFLTPKLYGSILIWNFIILLLCSLIGMLGFFMGLFILISDIASLNSCGYPYITPILTKDNLKYRDIFYRGKLTNISNNTFNKGDKR
ncbi:spore germination protein [Clostridium moutaii]